MRGGLWSRLHVVCYSVCSNVPLHREIFTLSNLYNFLHFPVHKRSRAMRGGLVHVELGLTGLRDRDFHDTVVPRVRYCGRISVEYPRRFYLRVRIRDVNFIVRSWRETTERNVVWTRRRKGRKKTCLPESLVFARFFSVNHVHTRAFYNPRSRRYARCKRECTGCRASRNVRDQSRALLSPCNIRKCRTLQYSYPGGGLFACPPRSVRRAGLAVRRAPLCIVTAFSPVTTRGRTHTMASMASRSWHYFAVLIVFVRRLGPKGRSP